jgi:CHAT domain-containing protein/tetratricopeptide (TPR) repeat protein
LLAACADHAPHARSRLDAAFHAADSLRLEGRFAQASPILHALRDSLARAGDSAGLWRAELWWGDALLGTRQFDSARAALREAFALVRGDSAREGWTLSEHSLLLDRIGHFDSAAAEALRARALARTARDSTLLAATFNETGRIHSLSGRYREALDDNIQALSIDLALGGDHARGLAIELNEIGIGYRHLGRFTDAEKVLGQALTLEQARANPDGIARVSFNLANVYVATGDDARALPLMLEALRSVEPTGNVRGEIFLHTDLAELYTRAGRYREARAHVITALALNRGAFAYSRIELLGALGRLEIAEARPAAAIVLLDSAIRSADSAGYARQRVSARASRARAAIATGDVRSAVRSSAAAVVIADSLDDPEAQVEAREANASALEAAGRTRALERYRATIALLESWRGRVALGDLRMGVAEPRLGAYEGAIRMLVQSGRAGAAFDVAEHARARLLLDVMRDREAGAPPSQKSAAPEPAPVPVSIVQRKLITRGRAMLAVFWGERDVYGWWITPTAVRAARLGRADSLQMIVEFLRSAIQDSAGRVSWRAPAQRAFAAFIAPLAPDASGELLVIADGPLSYVPVEVLLPAADSLPWGATRRIVYGPSASTLVALEAAARTRWERTLLAVGDPTSRMARAVKHAKGERADTRAPLPYAAAEAREIAAHFPGERTDLLIGRDATLAGWRALDPSGYRYLHFAAHASLNGLPPGTPAVNLADSALDLRAIRGLHLTAELVTLSACETALGQEVRGEGILGLTHAFLAAGAHGTVVTLWPIRDRSAADFMTAFYGELKAGAEPSDALLTVRRAWISSGDARSQPSRWAPYVLMGGLRGEAEKVGARH